MAFTWTCPYCERDTTITNTTDSSLKFFDLKNADGYRGVNVQMIVCPNPDCQKFSLTAALYSVDRVSITGGGPRWDNPKIQKQWTLIPPSAAKVFPNYVPKAIRDDYVEACSIRDLSPKASATLSRRCLQGIIRGILGSIEGPTGG